MKMKWASFVILLLLVFFMEHGNLFQKIGLIQPSNSLAQESNFSFTPSYRTEIDLRVRAEYPYYSFRTGEWILGKSIGVIEKGTRIHVIQDKVVGFTQLWLEVYYKLPDGNIGGGPGHWIWAGQKDSKENIIRLPGGSDSGSLLRLPSLSFVNKVWAQADIPVGTIVPKKKFGDLQEFSSPRDAIIKRGLESRQFLIVTYVGFYMSLLLGMVAGSIWDSLSSKSSGTSTLGNSSFIRTSLRLFVGSAIAFSFFIGPIMGFGGIGFTFSAAVLAFHFGLVHSDPTDLVSSLKKRTLVGKATS